MSQRIQIPIIDLFAGPGGLGEGFSSFDDSGFFPFRIGLSVEKDHHAHQTLRLRSFYRQFPRGDAPEIYYQILRQELSLADLPSRIAEDATLRGAWSRACHEARCTELGPETHSQVRKRIEESLKDYDGPWILIGGPPCQAYSLAGRVRNQGIDDYKIEDDARSTLYKEYLKIIAEHRPTIFVMENVTGLLSATLEKKKIFEKILGDLQCPRGCKSKLRYRIVPVVADDLNRYGSDDPRRFIVRCEEFGVPQKRHRVILVGVQEDLGEVEVPTLTRQNAPDVKSVLEGMPRLRSGISRKRQGNAYVKSNDSADAWVSSIQGQIGKGTDDLPIEWLSEIDTTMSTRIHSIAASLVRPRNGRGDEYVKSTSTLEEKHLLYDFLIDDRLGGVCNHSTRAHLESDLMRYIFCATFAKQNQRSPRLSEFPSGLLPNHKNANSGHFNDRFRVQLANEPATTITSHIAKDGHYFIHYDPTQCRSLTVREAARLQTFPDNYFFCGPRTEQYTQVGNAVPPWLARQIAQSVWYTLVEAGLID